MNANRVVYNFFVALAATLMVLAPANYVSAKSLYVIANINSVPTPVHTYDIQGSPDYLVFQAEQPITFRGGGGVGIAIDSDSAKLFVTYEVSNVIQLLDATTFADLGTTTAPGATNLSGIVVDQGKSRVYTVDRNTRNLYAYDWDATTDTLTLVAGGTGPGGSFLLAGVGAAYGIAFDELGDRLFVADATSSTVRYFETTNFTESGNIVLAEQSPISIAIDQVRDFLYTGGAASGNSSLVKYDFNTSTESSVPIEELPGGSASEGVIGVAVDEDTGNVYVTTGFVGDRLMVFDSSLNELQAFTRTEIIAFDGGTNWGDATGIAIPRADISFNPLNFSKVAQTGDTGEIASGSNLTYDLCYDNAANTNAVNNVTISDAVPAGTTFISATGGGTETSGTVTWSIGTLAGGAAQACEQLVVNVTAAEGQTVTNIATIDSDDTPPTSQTATTVVTVVIIVDQDFNIVGVGKGSGSFDPIWLAFALLFVLFRKGRVIRKAQAPALLVMLAVGASMASMPLVQAQSSMYAGASGGWTKADYSASDLQNAISPPYVVSNVSVDDSDTGWKIFGGYELNSNWAVEAAYVDLGEITTAFTATIDPADLTMLLSDTAVIHAYAATGFTASVVGQYEISPAFSVMGKIGAFAWEAEGQVRDLGTNQLAPFENTGTNVVFGIGFKYEVNPAWSIRTEWERYDTESVNIDFFSIGAEYRF